MENDLIQEFNLIENKQYIALCDLLKRTGNAQTGGMAKSFISEGLVFVDGKVELKKRCKIIAGQKVKIDSTIILVK